MDTHDPLFSKILSIERSHLIAERCRPGLGRFYDNSKGKIGKLKLGNNIKFMAPIQEPCLGKKWNNGHIQTEFKKTFFKNIMMPLLKKLIELKIFTDGGNVAKNQNSAAFPR